MVWEQLSVNSTHWVYLLLGAYTSIFMLVSSFIKEKLFIGEATIATIMGIILGPHAAGLIDPSTWGNVDLITLEFTRIILVVQCFAVGVELPKKYMEKHWKSIFYMLVPIMTWGWLTTSLFIWWMMPRLNWLESLAIAATVTATDPILASSVVGKGKFAQRVPKHIRDILSAESGCNDGAAFPFIYLSIYLIRYFGHSNEIAQHWFTLSLLYEIVFGSIYGVAVGYAARRAIRYAHDHDLVDRESFLVFYFVLSLFCAGSGSMLGLDDLLVGFAAGVGFSNDGWFVTKTEEAHVSNVIDLLLNLSFFLYFGTIIPWNQFNSELLGTTPWRLVIIAIFALLFRRIPPMVALKPFIPDIKTWREALFAGHFGPIGVGAVFAAILARAEFETESTTPLAQLPGPDFENYWLVELIWPIVCFLVLSSIVVHGSSVAVFTLGKRINTLTMTMSYTKDKDDPSWMSRLPRISSVSKSQARSSISKSREDYEGAEKNVPPGQLPPIGLAGEFLKRRKEGDDSRYGPGGPIHQSAISPHRRDSRFGASDSETLNEKESIDSHEPQGDEMRGDVNVYEEGNEIITEDKAGEVIDERDLESGNNSPGSPKSVDNALPKADESQKPLHRRLLNRWKSYRAEDEKGAPGEKRSGPAMVYHYGNTVIIEDENGEVIKKYDLPKPERPGMDHRKSSWMPSAEHIENLQKMANWVGYHHKRTGGDPEAGPSDSKTDGVPPHHEDPGLRFTHQGKRMNAVDFIKQIQSMDPKARVELVQNAPPEIQHNVRAATELATTHHEDHAIAKIQELQAKQAGEEHGVPAKLMIGSKPADLERTATTTSDASFHSIIPDSNVAGHISQKISSSVKSPTAAERRRAEASASKVDDAESDADSDDDGTERRPPISTRGTSAVESSHAAAERRRRDAQNSDAETEPERKRREAALGISRHNTQQVATPGASSSGNPSPRSLQWSHDVGKEKER